VTTPTTEPDAVFQELRSRITENDRAILELVNRRLELVRELWAHKARTGADFHDAGREAWLLQHLAEANRGPLSAEGLERLFRELLDLTKQELNGA
jgi:chorismate mutase/prephenate dehydratase